MHDNGTQNRIAKQRYHPRLIIDTTRVNDAAIETRLAVTYHSEVDVA